MLGGVSRVGIGWRLEVAGWSSEASGGDELWWGVGCKVLGEDLVLSLRW